VRLYSGFAPPNMYAYTASPNNMYSGGPIICSPPGANTALRTNPSPWWYQLLPGGYTLACFKDSTTNDYMNIFRSSYNSNYDIISFDVDNGRSSIWSNYVGSNQLPGSPLNYSSEDSYDFLVCKGETVSAIVSYGVGTATMSFSIKSQGCSDKINGSY